MKRLFLSVSLVALILGGAVQTAQAVPLSGKVDYTGSFEVPAPTFLPPSTQFAVLSANVSDVVNTSGLLATFIVPPTTLTHASPVVYDPVTPYAPLFTHASGVSFELTDFTITERDNRVLVLRGTGIFRMAGYDDTPGQWVMTLNRITGVDGTYSASASIPEPGLLGLLGLGLIGLARSVRSRR